MDSQTPASLFDAYYADFLHLIDSIRTKLDVEIKEQRGEQRKATLRKVELELDEIDDIISQLEVEIQGIPLSIRSPYNSKLKQAKLDMNRYKKLSKDVHSQASRNELLGGANTRFNSVVSDDPYNERSDRQRLLAGTDTLSDGNRRILESQRIANETEAQGGDILRDLVRQREQLEHSRTMLQGADGSIDRAAGTLKGMIWQMKKQRFIIGSLIGVLILVVVLILYFKLTR